MIKRWHFCHYFPCSLLHSINRFSPKFTKIFHWKVEESEGAITSHPPPFVQIPVSQTVGMLMLCQMITNISRMQALTLEGLWRRPYLTQMPAPACGSVTIRNVGCQSQNGVCDESPPKEERWQRLLTWRLTLEKHASAQWQPPPSQ